MNKRTQVKLDEIIEVDGRRQTAFANPGLLLEVAAQPCESHDVLRVGRACNLRNSVNLTSLGRPNKLTFEE